MCPKFNQMDRKPCQQNLKSFFLIYNSIVGAGPALPLGN